MVAITNFRSAEVDWRYDLFNLTVNGQYVHDVAYMDQIFDHIKKVGFDTISIATNVPINIKKGIVSTTTQSGEDRSLPVNTWKVVDLAQSKGLNVLLKLYICDVENDNQIRTSTPISTAFSSDFSSQAFFESITSYERDIAREAQKHGVDGIYVGVEQTGLDTIQYYNDWKKLISEVRSVFNGAILYSGHYDASKVPIYDLVDIAAVSVFYEWLSDKRSTDIHDIKELYKSAHNIMFPEREWNVIDSIKELYNSYKKPIILDNIGFFAGNHALHNIDIWSKTIGGASMDGLKADYELQIARYNALLNIVANDLSKEVSGINFEQYMPWVDALVYEFDKGSTDIWQKQYAQFARLGFSLNHQPPTEKYISDFIKESWGFRTYFPGSVQGEALIGTKYDDYFVGSPGNDVISGGLGNDTFRFGATTAQFDGGEGIDIVKIGAPKAGFIITSQVDNSFKIQQRSADYFVTANNTERVKFTDNAVIALDVQGNAGQAYRLYQAALDRTPDERGLAGWIKFMDEGGTLTAMSQQFIDSQEFRVKYGALDDSKFVNQLYLNVLDRNGEPAGIAGWVSGLANGLSRAYVLKGFSESSENQANVIGQIKNGIPYVEWWLA